LSELARKLISKSKFFPKSNASMINAWFKFSYADVYSVHIKVVSINYRRNRKPFGDTLLSTAITSQAIATSPLLARPRPLITTSYFRPTTLPSLDQYFLKPLQPHYWWSPYSQKHQWDQHFQQSIWCDRHWLLPWLVRPMLCVLLRLNQFYSKLHCCWHRLYHFLCCLLLQLSQAVPLFLDPRQRNQWIAVWLNDEHRWRSSA
jgi:hypothetical protein